MTAIQHGSVSDLKRYPVIILFVTLVAVSFSPLLELTETRLSTHMIIEHTLFFLIGALSVLSAERILRMLSLKNRAAYLLDANQKNSKSTKILLWYGNLLRRIFSFDKTGVLWLAIAVVLMTLWHLPHVFDTAAVDVNVHILQHFSFAIVGAAGFLAMRVLGESFKIFLLIVIIGMMSFAGLLFSVLDIPVYRVYSVDDHNEAGAYMIISCILLLLVGLPFYLIKKTLSYVHSTATNKE
jgi:cytochrome c oxidase assembly factor CtaG